jgi:DVNP family
MAKTIGTREEVYDGLALKTQGNLTKKDLIKTEDGTIKSIRASKSAQARSKKYVASKQAGLVPPIIGAVAQGVSEGCKECIRIWLTQQLAQLQGLELPAVSPVEQKDPVAEEAKAVIAEVLGEPAPRREYKKKKEAKEERAERRKKGRPKKEETSFDEIVSQQALEQYAKLKKETPEERLKSIEAMANVGRRTTMGI